MNDAPVRERMIAPDLVDLGPCGPRIVAGRRKSDGKVVFPFPTTPESGADCERILLAVRGTLWSWTVQRFRPKSPPYAGAESEAFRPFLVGFVEFPEGVVVEGRIDAEVDAAALAVGMPMETTVVPLFVDAGGEGVCIQAFRPAREAPSERGAPRP